MSSKTKAKSGQKKGDKAQTDEPQIDVDAIFEQMDLNHDGRISVIELTKAARLLGHNPTRHEAAQMIADCNPSHKGYVNRTEFRRLFDSKQAKVDEQIEDMKKAFAVFDKDGSGFISRDEIRTVLRMAGEVVDEAEVEEMLKKVDADGDGDISIEEFASVMCDFD